ncbi:PTS sugar transporter subunit IIA [Clostridium sp.]|uniref:PTS sugar transporter subunit IIA n=1 Tax=Clostridium sp. TaxID=1506 RepID=UPI003D6C837E
MNENVIEDKNILLNFEALEWEECVKKAGELLYENKYVEQKYVQAMIDVVKELGPYIVLAPGIAFAHARPSTDVIKTGISMITLKSPVKFGNKDNDPVSIVFAIAAESNTSHIGLLQRLCIFLELDENVEFLKRSQKPEEVSYKINNFIKGGI